MSEKWRAIINRENQKETPIAEQYGLILSGFPAPVPVRLGQVEAPCRLGGLPAVPERSVEALGCPAGASAERGLF